MLSEWNCNGAASLSILQAKALLWYRKRKVIICEPKCEWEHLLSVQKFFIPAAVAPTFMTSYNMRWSWHELQKSNPGSVLFLEGAINQRAFTLSDSLYVTTLILANSAEMLCCSFYKSKAKVCSFSMAPQILIRFPSSDQSIKDVK